ncbi:hypothetical protein D3C73_951820 [compost metagenome]
MLDRLEQGHGVTGRTGTERAKRDREHLVGGLQRVSASDIADQRAVAERRHDVLACQRLQAGRIAGSRQRDAADRILTERIADGAAQNLCIITRGGGIADTGCQVVFVSHQVSRSRTDGDARIRQVDRKGRLGGVAIGILDRVGEGFGDRLALPHVLRGVGINQVAIDVDGDRAPLVACADHQRTGGRRAISAVIVVPEQCGRRANGHPRRVLA